jgi:hypothetical protein
VLDQQTSEARREANDRDNIMNETRKQETYTIRIKGHLSAHWTSRFEGMRIVLTQDGETHLIGDLPDQAALHGLLRTIRDSGFELLAVNRT